MLGTKILIKIIHIIIYFCIYFSIKIEKESRSTQKYAKITEVSISLKKSQSRPKITVLAMLIETKSRYLDRWD
jgi:hypothetical protein